LFLVFVYLPLYDNQRARFPESAFSTVGSHLAERFGGVTAFTRSPADGLWKDHGGGTDSDEIVVFEVLCATLDREWWRRYKEELREGFRQKEILIRAQRVELL